MICVSKFLRRLRSILCMGYIRKKNILRSRHLCSSCTGFDHVAHYRYPPNRQFGGGGVASSSQQGSLDQFKAFKSISVLSDNIK